MQTQYRWLIVFFCLIAALVSYGVGSSTGIFLFVILGFIFEMLFWFKLYPRKKSNK